MRIARFLLLLLLVGSSALAFYGVWSGWFTRDAGQTRRVVADQPDAKPQGAAAKKDEKSPRPTFDIVRAESDGSVIMAGQSTPGWTVVVESNDKEIGRATADENGEWIIQPKEPLSKGEHSLELSAKSPENDSTLFSKQRLALSLSDPKDGQPLVALTEEGKATRILQMTPPHEEADTAATAPSDAAQGQFELATATPDANAETADAEIADAGTVEAETAGAGTVEAANTIGFASVDYEDAGEKSMLHMSGHAKPDTRIAIYVDNKLVGTTTADATGSWSFSGNRELHGGDHALRADLLSGEENAVVARAEVNFEREPVVSTALLDDSDTKQNANEPKGDAGQADNIAGVTTTPSGSAQDGKVVIIKRGDTLWQIAQRHYGDGTKYTQIFQNNRKQIRNPNWIYPDQRFELP